MQSKPVPGISAAVKQSLAGTPAMRALQPVLLRTLATPNLARNGFEKPVAIEKREFDYSALDSFDISKLPANKAAALVFACNGAECWKSYKASHAAPKAGHSKVFWFRGGLPEWRTAERQVASTLP